MEPAEFFAELREKQARVQGVDVGWVEAQLQARLDARAQRDWAAADAIRDALLEKRIMIMDSPAGVTWRIQV
ncbi:MAG: cysteinyl-tRNA synthetase [Cognaticolwellia sp.]|jgi:cysteinyl-tRNA synthetase